jgi:hypothetical protein
MLHYTVAFNNPTNTTICKLLQPNSYHLNDTSWQKLVNTKNVPLGKTLPWKLLISVLQKLAAGCPKNFHTTLFIKHCLILKKVNNQKCPYGDINVNNPITRQDKLWGFQEVEAPRLQDNRHMKVVRLSALHTGRLYPPGNIPGTNFCYRLSQPQGHIAAGRIMSMKNSSDTIGNWTRDLPACSAVPQPTVPPCAPYGDIAWNK